MTWEIADRENPDRAGPRFDQLARVARELEAMPRGRYYARWVTGEDDNRQTPTTEDGER